MKKIGFNKSAFSFSYVAIGRIIGNGIQAVFYFILAMLLEPSAYGELSYLIAIAGTGSIIARFGLNHTITISQSKKNSALSNQVNLFAFLIITFVSITVLFIDVFSALLLFSISTFIMNQHNLLGLKQYKKYMLISLCKNGLLLLIPISLYFVFDLNGIIIGMIVSNLIFSYFYFINLNRNYNSFVEFKQNLSTTFHNFGVDISTNLSRNIDKLFIVPILGFSSTGIYQLNLQILFAFEMIPLTLHSFLLSEESSGNRHSKLIFSILLISIISSITLIIFCEILIDTFFPKYIEGVPSLQILIITLIPLTISSILNAKLQSIGSTKVGFSAVIRIGILIILLSTLGNWYGLIGLSLSVLISTICYTVFTLLLYFKTKNS